MFVHSIFDLFLVHNANWMTFAVGLASLEGTLWKWGDGATKKMRCWWMVVIKYRGEASFDKILIRNFLVFSLDTLVFWVRSFLNGVSWSTVIPPICEPQILSANLSIRVLGDRTMMWFCHRVTKIWSVSCHWMAENLRAIFNELHICREAEFMDQTYHKGFIATPTMLVLTDSFHMLCQHKSNVCYSVSCFRRQFSHDRSLSPCRNSSRRVWHDSNVGSVFPQRFPTPNHLKHGTHLLKKSLGGCSQGRLHVCFGHNHFHIWRISRIHSL